ncbi:MAG: cytochrome c [Proteobacteria bacterium]|nr:cytochrome c [Pseudomonadota bacterium]
MKLMGNKWRWICLPFTQAIQLISKISGTENKSVSMYSPRKMNLSQSILCVFVLLIVTAPLSVAQQERESNGQALVWDGVYTEAQAMRGRDVYEGACGFCHGFRLDGAADDPDMRSAPPLARAKFLRDWEGRSLAVLFELTRTTMPEGNPNSLTDAEYADVIAYMLSVSRIPAGDDELLPELQSLARIVIQQQE